MTKSQKRLILLFILMIAIAFSRPFSAVDVYADDAERAEEIEGSQESYIPDAEDDPDNDKLFESYVESELNEALPSSGKRLLKAAKPKLSEANLAVYNSLKKLIEDVAAGNRSSTEFTVSLEELNLETKGWTAEELGVYPIITYITDENGEKIGTVTQEAVNAIYEKIGFDLQITVDALIADCPYDLYWYDKTLKTSLEANYSYWKSDDPSYEKIALDTMTFKFPVAHDYYRSAYQVDTSRIRTVNQAVINAKAIVASYEDSDYARLISYKEAICDLVGYDYDAARIENYSYGNPWQIINVFDGDPDTNVVCEGYAKAFQYLCDLTEFEGDISCISVSGTMTGGTGAGKHMWNVVTMEDGLNYLVDVTNCDKGSIGADDRLFLVGTAVGDADTGYSFLSKSLHYSYDADTRLLFSDELQLANCDYNSCINGMSHILDTWELGSDSSCLVHGKEKSTCVNCRKTIYRSLELLEHNWDKEYTYELEPTCSSYGIGYIYCNRCHGVRSSKEIPKLAHTMGAWTTVKKASYSEKGLKERSCKVCGYTEQEELAKLARTSIANAKVSNIKTKVYTGKALNQSPVVKVGGKTLKSETDYSLTYSKNKNVGVATVKITGKGAYKGSVSKTFKIKPKATSLKSVTSLKKGFTAKWTKKLTQTTGYQLQYSTNKSFTKNKKTKTITKNSKTSIQVTGLKAKKKYYVRIRTYKTVSGKKYYSSWSKAKTVTTKK